MRLRNVMFAAVSLMGMGLPLSASAWFFIFPIPNVGKPAPLEKIIDALEKSDQTKAVAFASEDKVFGSKYWVWSQFSGHVSQAEADRRAMSQCEASLANAKAQRAGGQPIYDFGKKTCELHTFINNAVSPQASEQQQPSPPQTPPVPPAVSLPAQQLQPAPSASQLTQPIQGNESAGSTAWTAVSSDGERQIRFNSLRTARPIVTYRFRVAPAANLSDPTGWEVAVEVNCDERTRRNVPIAGGIPTPYLPTDHYPVSDRQEVEFVCRWARGQWESTAPKATPIQATVVPAAAPAARPPSAESSGARRLRELNELRKEGLISDSEFEAKKKEILSAM